ncbi:MAG: NUDIX hydrolase [Clostridia bacterium]|nr:NUDIX hydrolase [Clostridia bacterium]
MKLFSKEVKDMKELNQILKDKDEIPQKYDVAVIVFAFDEENRIVFQRRGLGCRDEQLKLETIGGRVKQSDIDFRTALQREIIEEAGNDACIELQEFIVSTYAKTFDVRNKKEQNWIYLLYKGFLKSGELEIVEPDKCLGYERYKIGEVNESELSNGARELYNIVSEKYSYLK